MHPSEKIVGSLAELSTKCQVFKEAGTKIVLTSGCFDLLHPGHLEYIHEASQGGVLVVGINSDAFVKRLKGPTRPIMNEKDRAFMMAGFYPVELVAIFDQDNDLIKAVEPDYYIASNTSNVRIMDDLPRTLLLESLGTKIIELVTKRKHDSTTDIIKRAGL